MPLAGQTCVDIKDNVVDEGFYFTPKGDDPCLSCTCHRGEPEMCVAALCERPQGCQQYRKDPKECCKFMCLDPGETPKAKNSQELVVDDRAVLAACAGRAGSGHLQHAPMTATLHIACFPL